MRRSALLIIILLLTACAHQAPTAELYNAVQQSVAPVGRASGVIVADGYMLTAAHVVATAPASAIVEIDQANDLALVRADTQGGVIAKLSNAPARIGEQVMVVGYPLRLVKQAVSGIISATGQNFPTLKNVYLVDASINGGHSGAPLFNESGQVLAIISATVPKSMGDIGIAIPIDRAFPMLRRAGL
jgi:S1-C subfamily serine protease